MRIGSLRPVDPIDPDPPEALGDDGGLLDGMARCIRLAAFESDTGVLTPVTFAEHSFVAVRAFVVRAAAGAERGGHAHLRGRQLLMWVSGEIDIELDHRGRSTTVELRRDGDAVLVEPGVWASQRYRGDQPTMVVFCDTEYDPADYVHERVPTVTSPRQGGA